MTGQGIRPIRALAAVLTALVVALALTLGTPSGAIAVQPDEVLDDPALEARARALGKELRCLVCQNQSIDDSDAPLARDLRVLVRERLVAGDSDRDVRAFVVARYGDFVLYRPPFRASTVLLWLGPLIMIVLGASGIALYYRRRARAAAETEPLSEEERRRLDALLKDRPGEPT